MLNADDRVARRPRRRDQGAECVTRRARAGRRLPDRRRRGRRAAAAVVLACSGHEFSVPLHGAHHAQNAAQAIAVAHGVFALAFDEIAARARAATPAPLAHGAARDRRRRDRAERRVQRQPHVDGGRAASRSRRLPVAPARRIAVLGDMRELGAHHDDAHRDVGQRAAALGHRSRRRRRRGRRADRRRGASRRRRRRASSPTPTAAVAVARRGRVRPGDAVLVQGAAGRWARTGRRRLLRRARCRRAAS